MHFFNQQKSEREKIQTNFKVKSVVKTKTSYFFPYVEDRIYIACKKKLKEVVAAAVT